MEVKKNKAKVTYRIFWGVLFLLAGAAIILNITGLLEIPNGVSAGNVIWTVVLALVFIWSILHRFWFLTFFSLVGAGFVWRAQLGAENIGFWPVAGAALLLSIGFSILFRPSWKQQWVYVHGEHDWKKSHKRGIPHDEEWNDNISGGVNSSSSESENDVFIKTKFGETIKYVNAKALKHAYIDCAFGSVKAYFDNAVVHEDGAVIEIENSFGGVELYIPKEWHLIDDTSRIFAGVDIKNPSNEAGTGPKVTLTGNTKFGGIEIIYV